MQSHYLPPRPAAEGCCRRIAKSALPQKERGEASCHSERSEASRPGFFAPLSMTALHMRSCQHRFPWERGRPARMQARCLRSLIRRQHPEAAGYDLRSPPSRAD